MLDEQRRYFHAYITVLLVNGERVKRTVYSFQSDSVSPQDTLDGIEQIVGDQIFDKQGFDAPVERVEINGKWLITEQEYYDAPDHQRL